MGCLTTKASGSIANFISPTVTPIESAKVYFSPMQLGEGTPSPENVREIVGRTSVELKQCGKNLLNPSIFTNVGYIINGNIVANSNFKYSDLFYITKGEYVFSGINGNSASSNVRIHLYDKNGVWSRQITSQGKIYNNSYNIPFEITDNVSYIRLSVPSNLINGQIELGSTATPYESYQGTTIPFSWKRLPDEYQEVEYIESTGTQAILTDIPCQLPIKTDIDIMFTQRNDSYFCGTRYGDVRICSGGNYQNNVQWAFGTYKLKSGVALNTRYSLSTFLDNGNQSIAIDGNTIGTYEYTLSESEVASMNGNLALFAMWINNSQTFGQYAKTKCYGVKISNNNNLLGNFIPCYRKSDNEIGIYDTVSQTFYTNQGTGTFLKGNDVFSDEVYGGYVDLVKGEIVETIKMVQFTWGKCEDSAILGDTERRDITFDNVAFKKIGEQRVKISNIYSNFESSTAYWDVDEIACMFANRLVVCKLPINSDDNTIIQIAGELKTPITHPLPDYLKTQLQTLKNENTFWSDADSVEIDYGLAETFDIQKAKRKIIMNQPHVESASNSPSSPQVIKFKTDMKAPLKECIVNFAPIQEGSGDPSPTNIRPIKGWNGITLNHTGINMLNCSSPSYYYDATNNGITSKSTKNENGIVESISFNGTTTGTNIFRNLNYIPAKPNNITIPSGRIALTTYSSQVYIVPMGQGNIPRTVNGKAWDQAHMDAVDNWTEWNVNSYDTYEGLWIRAQILPRQTDLNINTTIYPMMCLAEDKGCEFEPYKGESFDVDWTNDVGTVYGGYVDLVKGELVATHLAFVMDGTNYTVSTGGAVNATTNMARAHSYIGRTGMADLPEGKYNTGIYASNKYVIYGLNNNGSSDSVIEEGVYCGAGIPYVRVVVNADNLSDVSSASAIVNSINEWLQTNPVQICYQLAESITYQLTPQQLITLKGQNNLWADTNGTTEIKFWKH